MDQTMKRLAFIALPAPDGSRDGEAGWNVYVNGDWILQLRNSQMDVSDRAMEEVWRAIGVRVTFDYEES